MLRVVNLKKYELKPDEILIKVDRSSAIGNPFKMKNYEEKENDIGNPSGLFHDGRSCRMWRF